MNTCRLCHDFSIGAPLIGYGKGSRHYAHSSCMIEKWGERIIERLHPHQLGQLPALALKRAGLIEAVDTRIREYEQNRARYD